MATKTVAWNSGSGVITLTYTGQGNDTITVQSDANDSFDAREQSIGIVTTAGSPEQAANVLIKQAGKPLDWTVKDFEYTGGVQEVTLPKGTYKLECWGAQGGNVTGTYAATGSKGGYSEGVLTLTETTTLYIFVGGQGASYTSSASQTDTTVLNGGWNGGGAGVRTSRYNSGGTDGRSFPRGGGGATDIALVTSAISYSSGRTTRDSASLLSRIIVAGGGAGGSSRFTSVQTTETVSERLYTIEMEEGVITAQDTGRELSWGVVTENSDENGSYYTSTFVINGLIYNEGVTYKLVFDDVDSIRNISHQYVNADGSAGTKVIIYKGAGSNPNSYTFSLNSVSSDSANTKMIFSVRNTKYTGTITIYKEITETKTETSSGASSSSHQGGGTSGGGQYPGTQSSAGQNGAFGLGASQTTTNYRYCSGGGGGGWYGGGSAYSDNSTSYINYTGGGSGFVNTAANSSYRPSGYTGLELDSGSTTTGQNSGNGYAKITVLGDSDGGSGSASASITWATQSGTWTESSSSSAADGKSFTCTSPGTSGSTVIRCTFSGVTSITFNCVYNGESNYDYLTVGSLDTACTRSSYGTTLKGTSGTAKSITFSCDSGEHYVEFCYSKDGSVDTSPDNATVYVESYS